MRQVASGKALLLMVLVATGMIGFTKTAEAQLEVFTDQASFLARVQAGFYLEDFESFSTGPLASGQVFSGSGFSFTATAPANLFIVGPITGSGQSLSHRSDETLTLSGFTGGTPVTAIGGFFFPNSDNSVDVTFDMSIFASNGVDGETIVLSAPLSTSTFLGFVSNGPAFTILTADIVGLSGPPNADINDFIIGTATAVPAPAALPAGFALMGMLGLRRKGRGA